MVRLGVLERGTSLAIPSYHPSGWRLATNAPMHAIWWSGCLGKPGPRLRMSVPLASPMSSIRAVAARSGTVFRSQTMIDCSDIILSVLLTGGGGSVCTSKTEKPLLRE